MLNNLLIIFIIIICVNDVVHTAFIHVKKVFFYHFPQFRILIRSENVLIVNYMIVVSPDFIAVLCYDYHL